jgi:hypothetical protein
MMRRRPSLAGLSEKKKQEAARVPKTVGSAMRCLVDTAQRLRDELGDGLFEDHNGLPRSALMRALGRLGYPAWRGRQKAGRQRGQLAGRGRAPVIKPRSTSRASSSPTRCVVCMRCRSTASHAWSSTNPTAELRDHEQIPLLEIGGIEAFIRREVLPYTPDAWISRDRHQDRLRGQLHPALLQATSACARWPRSAPTSWPWRRRPRACWMACWWKRPSRDEVERAAQGPGWPSRRPGRLRRGPR